MLFNDEQIESIGDNRIMDIVESSEMVSVIIGFARFVDCFINHSSIWAEKSEFGQDEYTNEWIKPIYNWVATDPILFDKPVLNEKGVLSFLGLAPNEFVLSQTRAEILFLKK